MIEISDGTTIGDAFSRASVAYSDQPFLAVPSGSHRAWHRHGWEITFSAALRQVDEFAAHYRAKGFGHGHRIAMLLDNRPEHFLHKFALNTLGASCVPINPDYHAGEIAYLLANSQADLALVAGERREQMAAGLAAGEHPCPIAIFDALETPPNAARRRAGFQGTEEAGIASSRGARSVTGRSMHGGTEGTDFLRSQ